MKSLSLQRPLVLIVIGIPGAGKSFFANQFSDMFSAPLVSFDKIYHRLITTPTYKKEELMIVQDIVSIQAEELAKTNKVFIIDSGYGTKTHRLNLQSSLKKHGYDTITVWVQTSHETAKRRAMKRNPRKNDDMYNHSLSEQQFQSLSEKLASPAPRENYIVISGKHTFGVQAKSVLQRIVTPRPAQDIQVKKRTNIQPQQQVRRNIVSS